MPKTLSAKARARKIKLLLFDVDGVLTDGKLYIFPLPPESSNRPRTMLPNTEGKEASGSSVKVLSRLKGFMRTTARRFHLLASRELRPG